MSKPQTARLAAIFFAAVVAFALVVDHARRGHGAAGHRHEQAGPAGRQERALEAFDSIELRSPANLDITVGGAQAVALEADADDLAAVRTRVQDHTLVVDAGGGDGGGLVLGHGHQGPRLSITVPALKALRTDSAGSVRLHHLQGEAFEFSIGGEGDMKADGTVGALKLRIDGAGMVDTSALEARSVDVAVSGAGMATVRASESLTARLSGLGAIVYYGDPRSVDKQVSGLGSIKPAGKDSASSGG